MTNTDHTGENSGRSFFVWCAATAALVPIALATTSYFGGSEMVEDVGRIFMLASMWVLFALGIVFALLGLAAFVFDKVSFLAVGVGGAIGFLLFSGMLWFLNYPLHGIEEDIRARVSQSEVSN